MKILYLSLDAPLDPGQVATGNQVRVLGISTALMAAGHTVEHRAPAKAGETIGSNTAYHTRNELAEYIKASPPDVILCGYWSLLTHLPASCPPVILDFIAPRLLELMFQEGESLPEKARELIEVLPLADHFLVGNDRQRDLLLPLLLQAGFDCRSSMPVSILPISTRGNIQTHAVPMPLKLVNAGVDWPWRDASAYRKAVDELRAAGNAIELVELTGAYPGATVAKGDESGSASSTLVSYQAMQESINQCHIGLELGERNTEREFSHSFRAIEYLEQGLPVIINAWIPLAAHIRQFDAGWVVSSPEEFAGIIEDILANPQELSSKQAGAARLANEVLNYAVTCEPLLQWLDAPHKVSVARSQDAGQARTQEAPGLKDFVTRDQAKETSTFKVILGALFKLLFCPRRPDSTPDVLMMTRSDLFPTDHGAAVKVIRTAEALSRQGRDVWLTTDNRREYYQFSNGEMVTHRFPFYIRFFCLPRFVAFIRLLLKGYPASNSFLYLPVTDGSYIARTLWLTSRKPIGAYQAEFPAYVRPCRYARSLFEGKILLVQHNVEYDRIKNQVPDLSERNYHTLKNLEVAMCRLADNIVAVSENDRRKMINDGIDAEKIHTIPHGVDLQAFRETTPINIRAHYGLPEQGSILVYHGTYSYPPNLEAMDVMAREILPRLQQRNLSVTVLAIGSKPPDFPLHEAIRFVGSVDDLAEVIPAADLAVVTLQEGGGTRMKILDYFAAGVPVISTAKGIEGIPVKHGREALVIDDFDAICDAIAMLLTDPERAGQLAEAASSFVDTLSWDAVVRRYLPLLQ